MNLTTNHSHNNQNQGTLLIVDDIPTHLKALILYLQNLHFEVQLAHNGEEAIKQATQNRPDLILLDVLMPKMDGFETCRQLKILEETCTIPVIFMTALDDNVNKIKGFEVGGVDYITKPIHHEEVLARVNTHLNLRRLQHLLEQKNGELQRQNQKLERVAHIIAYDLKESLLNQTHTVKRLSTLLADKYLAKLPDIEPLAISQLIEGTSMEMLDVMDNLLLLRGHSFDS
jgi:two-component system, sensor histidine kinase and response regulator